MISIIIPVYNQADKIQMCLASILKQTYKDFEIIIVNDGSTDNLDEMLKNFTDSESYKNITAAIPGFSLKIISQENRGASAARNRGTEAAQAQYLIFCDADIVLEPDMIEAMLEKLTENPQASFCYSSFKFGAKTFNLWPYDPKKLRQMPYIPTTSLIRKECFLGFDENLKKFQDWDLWLTMLEHNHSGVFVNKVLFKAIAGGTMSSWLPSFAYKLLPFLPAVKKYKQGLAIIANKHHLNPKI